MDFVDLYQIHRFDYDTPIEETLIALNDLIKAGKVRYIGASAMFAWQFMKMLATSDQLGVARFVSMQNYYNLVYREEEREMLPLCRAEGIGVIPFSPLARGFVAGNRRKEDLGETVRARTDDYSQRQYYRPQDFAVVKNITEVANARGVGNAQVALAWVLQQPGITAPIIGASKMQHLDDAVEALNIRLDEAELKALGSAYEPRAIMAHS
jgi:aryl-alcohol dehydrogenase (NADP+)